MTSSTSGPAAQIETPAEEAVAGTEAQEESRTRRWPAKLLLLFGSILFSLLIAEIGLRLIGYDYTIFYAVDRDRGYALGPNIAGWSRKEADVYVRINSAGQRDTEHAITKPANTIRIAIIGDSYAEALQVPIEQAFWSVLREKLAACPEFTRGREVEVLNFGVSGYSTAQELITLRTRVWQYAPDIVILAFCTANDVSDNLRALKKTDIPYFVYQGDRLVLDNSFQEARGFRVRESALNQLGRSIRDSSRVIQAFHQGHYALKSYLASRRVQKIAPQPAAQPQEETQQNGAGREQALAQAEELGVDNVIYREPADEVWREAWGVTEGLLALMRRETEEHGARLVVVTLSNGIQVFPDRSVREQFMKRVGATDLFYPDSRVRAFCEREGIEAVTLAPLMQAHAERERVFLHGFGQQLGNGHWNAAGHSLAGQLIAEKLCAAPEQ